MQQRCHDDISIIPFAKDLSSYSWNTMRRDLMAAISVAILTVPQAMAFALVAGLPIICGLLAAVYSAALAAAFGSSRHLVVGPGNAISILVQGGISQVLFTYYRDVSGAAREALALQILTQLALLIGIIQILAGLFKFGKLTHFVSHTVIVGYTSGVALALLIGQVFPLVGIPEPPTIITSLYERSLYILTHLQLIHWPTAAVGFFCLSLILFLKKVAPKIPAGAFMLSIVAVVAYFIHYLFASGLFPSIEWPIVTHFFENIAVVGDARGSGLIPAISLPFFHPGIMNNLIPVAFAVALLGVMEATSVSKSIASNSGQRLSTNQEIFGLGLGNLMSAFIGAMPVTGSAVRSSVNYKSGAKTRASALFNSLFVLLILFAFGLFIVHLPLPAFAALLIASTSNIVNFKQFFLCLKATSSDAFVLISTLLSCLFFSLDIAFYIGVAMSIGLYLKKAAIPQVIEFVIDNEGILHSMEFERHQEPREIRLIKVEGELFFGAADVFQSTLKSITEDDTTTRVIILQLKNARDIDATGCLALQQLYEYLRGSGRHLIACGITHQFWDVLSDAGLIEVFGKSNLFIFDERHPQLSMHKAFARARDLIRVETQAQQPRPLEEALKPQGAAEQPQEQQGKLAAEIS